jgi:hypothetical protein
LPLQELRPAVASATLVPAASFFDRCFNLMAIVNQSVPAVCPPRRRPGP